MKTRHRLWMDQFLENCRSQNRSQHTLVSYSTDLKNFFNWYENTLARPLWKINAEIIGGYLSYLRTGIHQFPKKRWWEFWKRTYQQLPQKRPLKVASQKRHLSTLNNFFEFLRQYNEGANKRFALNPIKSKIHGIKLKDQDIDHTVFLPADDWDKILKLNLSVKDELLMYLMYWGGLRLAEVAYLRWTQIDFSQLKLNVVRKGGKIHAYVPQKSSHIFELLRSLRAHFPQQIFVFEQKNGEAIRPRSLHYRIRKVINKAGCRTRGLAPHSFRKACATELYFKTRDLLEVRDYLNHTDAKVTQTYIESREKL